MSAKSMREFTMAAQAPAGESVKVKLFRDNRRYKGDVFVSINGRRYQLQRGVEVAVPAEVAEVLQHSQQQDARAAERIARAESNADEK